jgi:cytochrome P450
MSRASIIDIPNLADPGTYADHDMTTVWTTLRSESPVYWHPESSRGPGFWVLTRYADVIEVLRDDMTYVSSKGNVLATLLQGRDPAGGRMIAVMDGEPHTELRKLLLRAFSPRVLEHLVHRVRQTARRLVTAAVERGECDFARDIASVIPLETICDLLDIPVSDRPQVLKLTKSALSLDQKSCYAEAELSARRDILAYFSGLIDERRKCTGTDPISLMIDSMPPGRRLDDIEIILNCYSLIMGGDETARLAMIGAVKALAEDPEQWAVLKDGKTSVESAAEEVLRWTTPTMHFGRVAAADSYLAGQHITAGDIVTLWLASANRDEQVFPQADKFQLGRSPNKHLSLGYGRHFCLGAYLGRVEIAAMLDAMRTFVTRIEQTGPEQRIFSNFLSGMSSLPISLEGDLSGTAGRQE